MESESYDLSVSSKKLGKLYPILKDAQGNIIDGFHRQNSDPDWPCITIESITNPKELELARLTSNFCRRQIPASEMQTRIAFLIGKCGMTADEIAETTGIDKSTIYRHMPQELKDVKKSEAISEGRKEQVARATSVARKTTPETLVECERCHVNSSKTKPWHGHTLCGKCFERAENNPEAYDGFFHFKERAKNGQVPKALIEKSKADESWEQRKAIMSPQHSKMEDAVLLGLQEKGVHGISQDREFCLQSTTPDLYFPQQNLAVYIDGSEVHNGKRLDRDEELRERLAQLHGIKVHSITYDNFTPSRASEIVQEIVGLLKEA